MRPRRKVTIYSQNEQLLGVLAYLLELRLKLDLTRCATAAEAANAGHELTVLILDNPEEQSGLRTLCAQIQGSSLLYDPKSLTSEDQCAASAYLSGQVSPARFLETVRALLVHRRGPKPKARKNSLTAASAT